MHSPMSEPDWNCALIALIVTDRQVSSSSDAPLVASRKRVYSRTHGLAQADR